MISTTTTNHLTLCNVLSNKHFICRCCCFCCRCCCCCCCKTITQSIHIFVVGILLARVNRGEFLSSFVFCFYWVFLVCCVSNNLAFIFLAFIYFRVRARELVWLFWEIDCQYIFANICRIGILLKLWNCCKFVLLCYFQMSSLIDDGACEECD